jgi:hypothetical protein
MNISTLPIAKYFFMTFGEELPDRRFIGMWNSNTDAQIMAALEKAKTWRSSRPEKTALDCAKIISALLRDERSVERRTLYYTDHNSDRITRLRNKYGKEETQ